MSGKSAAILVLGTIAALWTGVIGNTHSQAQPADPNKGLPGGRSGPGGDVARNLTRIIKFKPYDSEDGRYAGYLMVRSLGPDSIVERFLVPSLERLKLTVPGHEMDLEDNELFLTKGLVCDVQSKDVDPFDTPSHISKEVTRIIMSVVDVEGRIKKITDDMVRLRAKPVGGQPWPHLAASEKHGSRATTQSGNDNASRYLIVRFQILEDLTSIVDEDNWDADPSDIKEGEFVRATVIVGRPRGILLKLKAISRDNDDL